MKKHYEHIKEFEVFSRGIKNYENIKSHNELNVIWFAMCYLSQKEEFQPNDFYKKSTNSNFLEIKNRYNKITNNESENIRELLNNKKPKLIALPDKTKITARLISFLLHFSHRENSNGDSYKKNPPFPRGNKQYQFLDEQQFVIDMRILYHYRSRYFHNGNSFPDSMLTPQSINNNGEITEIPDGAELPISIDGNNFTLREAPMTLQVFAHIVRHALLNWWDDMANANAQNLNPQSPSPTQTPSASET